MGWFWLAVAIGIVIAAIEYWQYVLAVVVAITVTSFLFDQIKKARLEAQQAEAERQRVRREDEARIASHKAWQQQCKTELTNLGDYSLQSFESLPKSLLEAESMLDQAEQDFKEGAFAPFWESIEKAAMGLGLFHEGVGRINYSLARYGELLKNYEAQPPRFPVVIDSVKGMVAGNTTTDRMKAIVRQAQRNFQFASIYEQRKTNQILIAGFTNLAQALDGMGRKITESIDGLSAQVSEMSTSLNASMASLGEQMATVNESTIGVSDAIKGLHADFEKLAEQQKERHDRALDMLDNIQRRRMPSGFHPKNLHTKPAP